MANTIDFNALGQAIDTSWGRSSTPKTASFSVKLSLQGPDQVKAVYKAIVNFGTERQMIETKRRYAEESEAIVNEAVKVAKANYRDISGESISFKEVAASDSLEIISLNIHNPKRTAYYCKTVLFEVT